MYTYTVLPKQRGVPYLIDILILRQIKFFSGLLRTK